MTGPIGYKGQGGAHHYKFVKKRGLLCDLLTMVSQLTIKRWTSAYHDICTDAD